MLTHHSHHSPPIVRPDSFYFTLKNPYACSTRHKDESKQHFLRDNDNRDDIKQICPFTLNIVYGRKDTILNRKLPKKNIYLDFLNIFIVSRTFLFNWFCPNNVIKDPSGCLMTSYNLGSSMVWRHFLPRLPMIQELYSSLPDTETKWQLKIAFLDPHTSILTLYM